MQYEDYQTIPTLKIAISEHLYNTNALHDYISSYNISEDNLVFCKVYDECLQKLNAGEVDALISNVMDYNSLTMKMLERFHTTSNYICTKINNHIIYEINEALVRINLDYPSFFSDLNKKYYSERVATPLSRKEVECLKCLNSVQIPFVDGQGYLSHKENDKFVGILPKIADLVFNKLDLDYSTIDMGINGNDCDKFIKDNARVIVGCVYDNNWGKERNLRLSNPFFISEYSQLSRKDYEVDSKTCRVAAVKGFYYVDEYVLKNYSENQIIWYDNFVDCLDAIVSKKADITILNNYIAEYYQSLYKYNSLVHKLIGYNHPMCFGIVDDKFGILTSAINKTLDTISAQQLTEIIIEQTIEAPKQNSLLILFYKNPILFFVFSSLFLILIIVLILFIIFFHIIHTKNKALSIQVQRTEKANQAKNDFLSRMSHDIRTPINTIMGLTALAVDEENNSTTKKYLYGISTSSNFLLGLVNDILDVDKISSGKLVLTPQRYSYDEFTGIIETMFGPLCKKKNITFIYDKGSTDEDIYVDKVRFNQIFFNLISNAIKFTPNGGTVTYKVVNSYVENDILHCDFSISDTGCGMSKEFMKHMYEVFSQEKRDHVSTTEGSGLGLAIVKQLVDLMKGSISCKSEIGKGTEFSLHLDVKILPKEQTQKSGSQENTENYPSIKGKKVLLVDDHPLNREIAQRLLEKQGLIIVTAEDGIDALEKFEFSKDGYFDAVLMDIRMPKMNGYEATKAIRALKRNDSAIIPIIAMTADAYDNDIKNSIDAGMNDHISKPIIPELVYKTLSKWISQSKKQNDDN